MSERRLRNAAAPQVAVVESADELLDVVGAGTPNIEIRQHLDLRVGDGRIVHDDYESRTPVLSTIPLTVRAIRGNCTQPPPLHLLLSVSAGGLPGGFPMLPMRQNQCLIIVDAAFLIARDQVWLDGLYLRLMLPPQSSAFVVSVWPETVVPVERHKLWMTDITIQGNSWPHSLHELQLTWGVQVYDIDLLAQDCTFANLGGKGTASVLELDTSRVDLVNCTLQDNHIGEQHDGVVQGINNASIALHRPAFSGNSGNGHLLHFDPEKFNQVSWVVDVDRTQYFSDAPYLQEYCEARMGNQAVGSLVQSNTNLVAMQSWLEQKRVELGAIERPPAEASTSEAEANAMGCCNIDCLDYSDAALDTGSNAEPPPRPAGPAKTNESSAQPDIGLIIGVSVAILLGLTFAALLAAFLWWRKRGGKQAAAGTGMTDPGKERDPMAAVSALGSRNYGPSLCGIRLDAQDASTSGKAAGAAGVDSSGPLHATDALQPGLPSAEPRGGIGSMHAAPATDTTGTNHSEATYSVEARFTLYSEVMAQRGVPFVQAKEVAVSPNGTKGRDGQESPLYARSPTAGEGEGRRAMRPVSLMKAMFHQTTDLGTLADSDAWRTPSVPTYKTKAIAARPVQGAPVKERLAYIGSQLDAFGRRGVILERYELLGGDDRCQGGQAVVQFVRAPQNNHHYAVKLFASRTAYEDEKQLYLHCFPKFMPTVIQFVDNQDGKFCDPTGGPMPPCLVMEKGESLTERTMRRKNDIFTTIQIIGQVASCLAELHSQGWVHRDLKPGNIMFLPRTASWTLIDFGLAARTGDAARIGFTPNYAAPEVVAANAAGDSCVTADSAVDAWALGVIAFELLNRRPAFEAFAAPGEVERQLMQEAPLPWEGGRLTPEIKARLGNIKTPVLSMLCRDPAQRASCSQLAASLRAVFTGGGTTAEHAA